MTHVSHPRDTVQMSQNPQDVDARMCWDELDDFPLTFHHVIRVHALPDIAKTNGDLVPVVTKAQVWVANVFHFYLSRECGLDRFGGVTASNEDQVTYLIPVHPSPRTTSLTYGAAGLVRDRDRWILDWVWTFPFQRGQRFSDKWWKALEKKHGDFALRGPLSGAMKRLLARRRQGPCADCEHPVAYGPDLSSGG